MVHGLEGEKAVNSLGWVSGLFVCVSCFYFVGWFDGRGRFVAPAGDLLSFASPKESKQRKGDPATCIFPAVLACGVRRRTHCATLSLRSNNCGEPDHEAYVPIGTYAIPQAVRLGAGRREFICSLCR